MLLYAGFLIGGVEWDPLALWLVSTAKTSITTASTAVMISSLLLMFCGVFLAMRE